MTQLRPAAPNPVRRAAARAVPLALSTLYLVAGGAFDMVAVANVPGAAQTTLTGGATPTGVGGGLVLLVLVAWVAVYLRRRMPLVTIIAGTVLLLTGVSYLLFLVGIAHALLRRRDRTRVLAALALAGVSVFAVRELLTPWGGALPLLFTGEPESAHRSAWNLVTVFLALAALGLLAGLLAYARTRVEADSSRELATRQQRRADELSEQLARQAERERIARDIHDALSHRLSVISLQAGAFEMQAAGDEALRGRARTLREQVHASLEDLRSLLGGLRAEPAASTEPSPASMRAIGTLLRDLRASGVRIDAYVLIDDADRATAALDASVYRIVQESLTNAIKHAPGAPLSLFVEVSAAGGARIRVSNPVTPSGTAAPGSGQGLASIRHRTEELGGSAWLGEHRGGFIVDVTLPWSERG